MNITAKQRKMLWICIGVVVGSYVVRSAIDSARQAAYYQQQAIRAAQQRAKAKQKPASVAPPPSAAAKTDAAPIAPSPSSGKLSGVWHGTTPLEGRGICNIRFELREKEPDHFSGYSTFSCRYAWAFLSPKERAARSVPHRVGPDSAILTGAAENGVIRFHVDKTLGADMQGCALSSFTLTPFGNTQLAAEWQAGGCESGHALMQKVSP